ncbi:MAG: NnrS family protein [Pseudoxanthomonas sp.]|nr:NnrS family protein [Steroidobacteraceae bacterium]MBP7012399.1 NnrS family protein [Steroidobacteraceae bacterium]MBP7599017.1 NnrS family protein [Pseudoxanthomonas sp.]
MRANDPTASPEIPLLAAPHRTLFFAGLVSLLAASTWWGLHLLARSTGTPVFALALQPAPIWAHAYLMLFAVFPTTFFGFLFTVFPRWMNGPLVTRAEYVATASLFATGTLLWLAGTFAGTTLLLLACLATGAGLLFGTVSLFRVLLAAPQVVSHAVVVLVGLCVQCVALAGFAFGLVESNDFALHFAVRASLWGGLLPVFFAVCHRMVPFFSQGAIPGYVPWQPTWVLVAVVGLAYLRLLLGTAGALAALPVVDAAVFLLTARCALRWTSLRARGNPLLWTLYAGFAWLPIALLLQTVRDGAFALTGAWALGRAPIHALGMGFFGGMLVAMVTRVTMGHSGRPLSMDRITVACFVALQLGAASRVLSEVVTAPGAVQWFLLGSIALWLGAVAVWVGRLGGIYLAPRIDGKPG